MSFASDIARFAKKADVALESVCRAVVFELFSGVVAGTPVLTGRARANWIMSVGTGSNSIIDGVSMTGPVDSPSAKAAAGIEVGRIRVKLGDTYHLSNNLPYISRLEYDGWSGQAPEGMVRKNVARIEKIYKDAVRENRV